MPPGPVNLHWHDAHWGSADHYWHFMLGYFLPISQGLLKRDRRDSRPLGIHDCGPIMNRIMVEGLSRFPVIFDFDDSLVFPSPDRRAVTAAASPVVKRWDVIIRNGAGDRVRDMLIETRDTLAAMLSPWSCCRRDLSERRYLLLRRSPEPSFYRSGGGAKAPTYGMGRRSFEGIEEGQAQLEALGAPSLIYEAGSHNLACQINHFSRCAGVIGVRGADFANIIWAAPEAKIIMFLSSGLHEDPPQRALAALLGLDYSEVPHHGEISPVFDVSRVADRLRPA